MSEKNKGFKFKMHSLEDLGYTFKKPEKSVPTERINFSLTHNVIIDEESSRLGINLKPRFTYGKKEPQLITEFIFRVMYDIEGLDEILDKDEEGYQTIPNEILITLFSIAYSTMRGAFFEKGKGTMVERLIIPVINPTTIIANSKSSEK